jgi:hypothetical protein
MNALLIGGATGPVDALPFTVFTTLAPIRDEFLPAEVAEKWKLPTIIEDHFPTFLIAQPWYVWALVTALVLIFLILDGSYRVAAREADEKATLDAPLNSLAQSRSHISEDQEKHRGSQPLDEFHVFRNDLVIRNIWFQIGNLDKDGILHINIEITNRTRDGVNLIAVEGNILVSNDNERKSFYKLAEPRLTHHRISQIPPGREFNFILSQEVPSKFGQD